MENLSVMERFCDPATFDSLTTWELWQGGLLTTAMGMGTTFIVLGLIMLCIAFMGKILENFDKKKVKTDTAIPMKAEVVATKATELMTVVNENETEPGEISAEIVAVITAAIAAMQQESAGSGYVIRKINRTSGPRPAWGSAGTTDSLESRRF